MTAAYLAHVRRWATDDRGGVVDFAIIFPLMFFITMAIIQVGLYYHARSIAIGSCESALRIASAQWGNSVGGTAAGYAFIAQAAGTSLQAPAVVISRNPYAATCTITGKSISLVPGVHFIVTVNQNRPVERITYPGMG